MGSTGKKWMGAIALMAATAAGLVHADPVTHYSARSLNSGEYVYTPEYAASQYGYVVNYNGAATEGGASGARTWAFGNGAGGYVFKEESSWVYARSDLANGTLKAGAQVGLGVTQAGSDPLAPGVRYVGARAEAMMADTFSFYASTGTPYLWSASDRMTLNFSVDGRGVHPQALWHPARTACRRATRSCDSMPCAPVGWRPTGSSATSTMARTPPCTARMPPGPSTAA